MPRLSPAAELAAEVDAFVERYENAAAATEANVAEYLPTRTHPNFTSIALELLRVDLEWSWRRGRPRSLKGYRTEFPDLLADEEVLQALVFDERRLRDEAKSANKSAPAASKDAEVRFPQPGERVLGFRLIEELGRGAFACVYLAEQADLANRHVALKITRLATPEPQRLARLQHPAIVPIYSVHAWHGLQVICMPFRGRTTLAHVSRQERNPDTRQTSVDTRAVDDERTVVTGQAAGAATLASSRDHDCERPTPSPDEREIIRWMAELAAGLAHAHGRGLLHGDLKPANILLADGDQPLLLDFNLAQELSRRSEDAEFVGGTLPYMSPEQIRALQGPVDLCPASDLFGLGVIFFELLAGQRPFAVPRGRLDEACAAGLAARAARAPDLLRFAPGTSPAIAALVRKLLAERPEDRYPSAAALEEDLRRHLADRPLRHVRNPSLAERTAKWRRRHPRLSSGVSVAAVALVLLFGVGTFAGVQAYRARGEQAQRQYREFLELGGRARSLLWTPGLDPSTAREGRSTAEHALATLPARPAQASLAAWPLDRLSPAEQFAAESLSCELRLLLASESLRQADVEQGAAREAALASARSHLEAAWNSPGSSVWRRALLGQRAALESLEGHTDQAAATREEARHVDLPASDDVFLVGLALLADGQGAAAAERFAEAAALRPNDAAVWYFRGLAEQLSGNLPAANESLTAAVALAPQSYLTWFQRGVVRLDETRFRAAADDFDQALRLRPGSAPALVNRGLAAQGEGSAEQALRYFTEALEDGSSETRVYFLRAAAARKLGKSEQAAADLREGLARTPADERSWNARGLARLPRDPPGALADFEQALELYPHSTMTLRNKAHVLAEHLEKPQDALTALDKVVAAAPNDPAAWSGRGVLRGRLGQRDAALDDARQALARTRDPLLTYQAACIFAQTSRAEPADAAEAVRLLAVAWQGRPDLVQLAERDPDLQPLADRAEYQSALGAARILAKLSRP